MLARTDCRFDFDTLCFRFWNIEGLELGTGKFQYLEVREFLAECRQVQRNRIIQEFGFHTNFIGVDFFGQEARIGTASRSGRIEVETTRFITVGKAGIDIDRIGKSISHFTGIDQFLVAELAVEGARRRQCCCICRVSRCGKGETTQTEKRILQSGG